MSTLTIGSPPFKRTRDGCNDHICKEQVSVAGIDVNIDVNLEEVLTEFQDPRRNIYSPLQTTKPTALLPEENT